MKIFIFMYSEERHIWKMAVSKYEIFFQIVVLYDFS